MAKYKAVSILLAVVISGISATLRQGPTSQFTFVCENKSCLRKLKADAPSGVPLEVCKLNCDDQYGSLLPLPTGTVTLGANLIPFYPAKITFTGFDSLVVVKPMLDEATSQIFISYMRKMHPNYDGTTDPFPPTGPYSPNSMAINIQIAADDSSIQLGTDESYTLQVATDPNNIAVRVTITAATYFGARHGLETLSQLIAYNEYLDALQVIGNASITDAPAYKYRGQHLDTSRNFFSVDSIKRIIDGLSYNKLNIFHWHLTDTHSFPMEVEGLPQMTQYGAYSDNKIYSIAQMKDIVSYARTRGVKVVAEFDEPAHVGHGWQWGPTENKGNMVVCLDADPWYDFCVEPPCGQLNLANAEIYNVLETIFRSMLSIFDKDLFHMGGDEVHLGCYNSSSEITDWMADRGISTDREGMMEIWGEFQKLARDRLLAAAGTGADNVQAILWTSELTHAEFMDQYLNNTEYIIQLWDSTTDNKTVDIVSRGFKVIFSNYDTLYLDCGFGPWIGHEVHNWCSPYHFWQQIYKHDPFKIYEALTDTQTAEAAKAAGLLLGAEAPLWTEQADEHSAESRIFPRACALAENLWSNPAVVDLVGAELRMVTNRQRFETRGLKPDRLQPEWCSGNQNRCQGYPPAPEPPTEDPSTSTEDPSTSTKDPNSGTGSASHLTGSIILELVMLAYVSSVFFS